MRGRQMRVHVRCGNDIEAKLGKAGLEGDYLAFTDPIWLGPTADFGSWVSGRSRLVADRSDLPFDAVVDATNAVHLPALAQESVEPGGRLVYIGLAGEPSRIDTRALVLKDVTAVGILSASPGLGATIKAYAEKTVDPRPLVAATVALDAIGPVLAGERPPGAGRGPKIHVDPHLA